MNWAFFLLFIGLNIPKYNSALEYTGRFNNYMNHSCIRDCSTSSKSMICEYDWTLELYSTLSRACYKCPYNYTDCLRENCILADGFTKTIEVINRLMPGPGIQVCKGDTVIVNLYNRMRSERVTSIHWHGLKQKGTPYMDGVGMITQCPIIPHTSFQYKFVAEDPGTHFWHAHSGVQRADGVFGALIVREKKSEDVNGHLYDFDLKEHHMLLIEWTNYTFQTNYGPYMHSGVFPPTHTILVNGKGAWPQAQALNLNIPLETFTVKKGFRYRFRIVHSGIEYCLYSISIENHNMTVIASDGMPIEPYVVNAISMNTGERYDVIIETNANEERDYWIKIVSEGWPYYENVSQRAILRYERKNVIANEYTSKVKVTFDQLKSTGLQLRNYDRDDSYTSQPFVLFRDMKFPKNINDNYFASISKKPDKKFYLNFDLIYVNDGETLHKDLYSYQSLSSGWKTSSINRIKFQMPSKPSLYNWNKIYENKELVCNSKNLAPICVDPEICTCMHVLEIGLNDLVEMVFIDGGAFVEPHAIHTHGYNYAIIGSNKISNIVPWNKSIPLTNEFIQDLDNKGLLKRNFDRPPIKDTSSMATQGYTIIRFIADNPGFWLVHCHLESHSDSGMVLVLKVGDAKDLPPKPKNWPTCGSYSPKSDNHQTSKPTFIQLIYQNFLNLFSNVF